MKVKTQNGSIKGEIVLVKEDSLYLMSRKKNLNFVSSDIKSLRIKRKGSTGKGLLVGAGSGALFGAFLGLASYSTPNCDNGLCFDPGPDGSAAAGAILGFAVGSVCGGLVGSSRRKFQIDSGTLEELIEFIKVDSSKRNSKN